jgi:hypothetical protein
VNEKCESLRLAIWSAMNQKFLHQVLRVVVDGVEGTMTHGAIAMELRRRGARFTDKKLERAIEILHDGGYLKQTMRH